MQIEGLFKSDGIHIPSVTLGIDKYRNTALVNNWVHRSIERHIAAKDLITGLNSSELHGKMQRRSTARKGNGIAATNLFGHLAFDFVDILPYRRHPVGLICLGNVFELFAVHGRRA